MEKLALIRAAEITVRRAICERYPPGREREAWLGCSRAYRPSTPPVLHGVPAPRQHHARVRPLHTLGNARAISLSWRRTVTLGRVAPFPRLWLGCWCLNTMSVSEAGNSLQ